MPVVVFTARSCTETKSAAAGVAKSVVLKDVQSPERLFDETALFLHRVIADLPEAKRRCSSACSDSSEILRAARCWSSTTTRATSSL
jgi:hypothetical protein